VSGRAFLDSNVIIYAFETHPTKTPAAEALLIAGGFISVQTLNETANVLARKQRRSWPDIANALAQVRKLCSEPAPLTVALHETALDLASRHGVAVYDGLIVAAALELGCDTLLSEDLQDGRVFDGRLTVRNPFAGL
jgi:predicted nucleic acid-binding protein